MAISAGALILFDLFNDFVVRDPNPPLKSCLLSSGSKRRTKKRVRFADGVKKESSSGTRNSIGSHSCSSDEALQKKKVPLNHMILYGAILRNRNSVLP
ncbi:hypothetical protein M569_15269 [Genlisea aurea]|uniref:Uncharacterized protein n=1 Tax=Genlisea aurea TaxID=192259 RepID=S8C533_9LAMI|nr:hypothetical protein M569_15269 [Genlisea aurea]